MNDVKDTHVSLFLKLANPEKLSTASKILAQFTLRIVDQLSAKHFFRQGKRVYLIVCFIFSFFSILISLFYFLFVCLQLVIVSEPRVRLGVGLISLCWAFSKRETRVIW